jgi:hypothetical protein
MRLTRSNNFFKSWYIFFVLFQIIFILTHKLWNSIAEKMTARVFRFSFSKCLDYAEKAHFLLFWPRTAIYFYMYHRLSWQFGRKWLRSNFQFQFLTPRRTIWKLFLNLNVILLRFKWHQTNRKHHNWYYKLCSKYL